MYSGTFFLHRPVQKKYAAGAAHGSRGEQEKMALPCSIDNILGGRWVHGMKPVTHTAKKEDYHGLFNRSKTQRNIGDQ